MIRQTKRKELNCKTHRKNSALCCCCFRVAPKNISFKLTQNRENHEIKKKNKTTTQKSCVYETDICVRSLPLLNVNCWKFGWTSQRNVCKKRQEKQSSKIGDLRANCDRNVSERLAIKHNKYCAHGARSSRQQQ